ncbi:uncharacterized protein LOC142167959 [Nicotiana tabacum]|uniref:Uncharacterized protein LOC142167959 n=1 Tax=Nicotiana tabacum TaxID=4097 RepID=A0AC58SIA2_TOBAC
MVVIYMSSIGHLGRKEELSREKRGMLEFLQLMLGFAFESVDKFREALTRFAVKEKVVDKYVNQPTRVRCKCKDGCHWHLFASYSSRTKDFIVKKYIPMHICEHTNKNKLCNNKYLTEKFKDKIREQPNIRIFKSQQLVRKELGLYVGISICRKARNKAFKAGCRPCIGLDDYFLKGVCKGKLLVAVCKDGNNQILLLAWAVVEVENKFNWTWFLRLLKDDLELGDGTNFTFITHMQKMCARHILANWSKKWRGIERSNYFWRYARSTYEAELKKNLDFMERLCSKGIIDALLWYNKERWSKVYFKFFSNCDSVDNNMDESFNSWIVEPRHKTIITMLDKIRVKIMNMIGQLREFANGWICDISPVALKVLQDNTTKSIKCDIMWNGDT